MERLVVLVVLTCLAIVVSILLQRRRPEAPTAPSYRSPIQVDRSDFHQPGTPTLIAMFTSVTCDGCVTAWDMVKDLTSKTVAIQKIEIEQNPDLHRRYKIDGVPTTLVVDGQGVVLKSYFGPLDRDELDKQLD